MNKKIIRVGLSIDEISNYKDYDILNIHLNPYIKMENEKKLKKLTSLLWEAKENNGRMNIYSRDSDLVTFLEGSFNIFLTKY